MMSKIHSQEYRREGLRSQETPASISGAYNRGCTRVISGFYRVIWGILEKEMETTIGATSLNTFGHSRGTEVQFESKECRGPVT